MKILMVSPFPPLRDGVGKYAAQEVRALRDEGHEVEVLAPIACAAHYVVNFKTWAGGLAKLRAYARRYDRVILQYQPAHFHWKSEGPARITSNFWMMVAFRTIRNLEIVCHEIEYPAPGWPRWRPEKLFDRMAWGGARHVTFHTAHELEQMRERIGVVPRRTVLREHGRHYSPWGVLEDRPTARRRLGVPAGVPLLLCIGFIQPHKGFDRAIRAFQRVSEDARLVVVGSVRTGDPEHLGYLAELRHLASADERVQVIERSLSDDEFDRWIVASDAVLLPYREIWSSAVLERARVCDRPVIASAVGGLGEQIRPGDILVANDEELARAIATMVGGGVDAALPPLTVPEAMARVSAESRRRGAGGPTSPLDRALFEMDASQRLRLEILPSRRRYIGRLLDIVKRFGRRALSWLLLPMMGQIDRFNRSTLEAMEEIARRQDEATARSASPQDPGALGDRVRAYAGVLDRGGPNAVIADPSALAALAEVLREEGLDVREACGDPVLYLARVPAGELAGAVISSGAASGRDGWEELLLGLHRTLRDGSAIVIEPGAVPRGSPVPEEVDAALRATGFTLVDEDTIDAERVAPPLLVVVARAVGQP